MSVVSTLVLPSQPTLGAVTYEPLGGNGYDAPLAAYIFANVVQGDASGGYIENNIVFDDQFTAIVQYVTLMARGGAADVDYIMNLRCREPEDIKQTGTVQYNAITSLGASAYDAAYIWDLPVVVCTPLKQNDGTLQAPYLRAWTNNNNNEDIRLGGRMFLFKKDAKEKVPLWYLKRAIVR